MSGALSLRRVARGALTPGRGWQALRRRRIDTRFLKRYYEEGGALWETYWLGTPVRKIPLDLWTLQEILYETRPDLIVETGTDRGGSALFMGCMCDMLGHGEIVSIDIDEDAERPVHPRVTYLTGSSSDPAIIEQVKGRAQRAGRVMIVLDSDHSKKHVLDELHLLSPLVTPGCYLIVEDTIVNGNPVLPEFGPGPGEAVQEFLAGQGEFVVDARREKFHVTTNRGGYLRRI